MLGHREGWAEAWAWAGGEQGPCDHGFVLTGGKPEGQAHQPGPGSEPPPIRAGEATKASRRGRGRGRCAVWPPDEG